MSVEMFDFIQASLGDGGDYAGVGRGVYMVDLENGDIAQIDMTYYGIDELITEAIDDFLNEEVNGALVDNPDNYSLTERIMFALEAFAQKINRTVIVTGGKRPDSSTTGAGSTSQHVIGHAADIKVEGMKHLELANLANESGLFGGIGWYEEGWPGNGPGEGPHVHVDLRENGPARWGYDRLNNYYRGYFPKYPQ